MAAADRCKGRTKAGKRCRFKAAPGTDRCRRHAKKQGQVLTLVPGGKGKSGAETKGETKDKPGHNEQALERTLRVMGREEDADAARFQMLRSLAKAVDYEPTNAALWKQYREALTDFLKDAEDADDSLKRAFEALGAAT